MSLPSLTEIEEAAAIVHRHMKPTPEIAWPLLAERLGTRVVVKHENHTPIGAFKAVSYTHLTLPTSRSV